MHDVYVSLSEVPRLLEERRWLRPHVAKWWRKMGWDTSHFSTPLDSALVFAKAVASCRYEDILFSRSAATLGLRPVWLEYTESHLSTELPYKRCLLHPIFVEKRGRNGGLALKKQKLASIQDKRMQRIDTIRLDDGTPLIDYHHRLHGSLGLGPQSVVDFSSFYRHFGRPRDYYLPYLSFFLAHAVLVEDFHDGEDASIVGEFTETIFAPAFETLKRHFGMAPLIARLPWHEHLQYFPLEEKERRVGLEGVIPQELLSDIDSVPALAPSLCHAA